MSSIADREQDEQLATAVKMFVDATPPVDAPMSEWRAGFEALCANFEVPADAEIAEVDMRGVPGRRVVAPGADPNRVVLHFHSGGYVQGSSLAYRNFAYRLSAVAKAVVIVPDYRLAPDFLFPAPVEDAEETYRWALENWAPDRIVVTGDSVGGGLGLALLTVIRDKGLPQPAAGVAISPNADLAGEGESAISNADTDPLIDQNMIVEIDKVYVGPDGDLRDPLCSPVYGDMHELPPLLLLASTTEVLRDDAVRFADGVRAAGGAVELVLAPGMVHIWTLFPFLEQTTESMRIIGDFITSKTP